MSKPATTDDHWMMAELQRWSPIKRNRIPNYSIEEETAVQEDPLPKAFLSFPPSARSIRWQLKSVCKWKMRFWFSFPPLSLGQLGWWRGEGMEFRLMSYPCGGEWQGKWISFDGGTRATAPKSLISVSTPQPPTNPMRGLFLINQTHNEASCASVPSAASPSSSSFCLSPFGWICPPSNFLLTKSIK